MTTVLPSRHYSGYHKAAEEEDDPGTAEKWIWRRKCGPLASGTAGGKWRRQRNIKLNESSGLWPMLHWE